MSTFESALQEAIDDEAQHVKEGEKDLWSLYV